MDHNDPYNPYVLFKLGEQRQREQQPLAGVMDIIRRLALVYFASFWLLYLPLMAGLWALGLPSIIDAALPPLLWFVAVFVGSDGSEPWLDGRYVD